MNEPTSVTVITSYVLPPQGHKPWLGAWSELGKHARAQPTCRSFHLLRDHWDNSHFVVLSEWDSPNDFNRFVREVGLHWIDRGLAYSHTAPEFFYLKPIPAPEVEQVTVPSREEMSVPV